MITQRRCWRCWCFLFLGMGVRRHSYGLALREWCRALPILRFSIRVDAVSRLCG